MAFSEKVFSPLHLLSCSFAVSFSSKKKLLISTNSWREKNDNKRHCERMQSENRLSSSCRHYHSTTIKHFCFLVLGAESISWNSVCCISKAGSPVAFISSEWKSERDTRRWGTGENSEGKFSLHRFKIHFQLRFIIIAWADEKILVSMASTFKTRHREEKKQHFFVHPHFKSGDYDTPKKPIVSRYMNSCKHF